MAATSGQYIWTVLIIYYLTLALSLALALYEVLITIEMDATTVWRRKITVTSILFISMRLNILVSAAFQIQFLTGSRKVSNISARSSNEYCNECGHIGVRVMIDGAVYVHISF